MEDKNSLTLARLFQGVAYLGMLVFLFQPIRDADVWWHLATGRVIATLRAVPHVDVFSLTAAGSAWINTYWFFDLLLYAQYMMFGLAGVIALHAFTVSAALAFQQARLREEGLGVVASLVAVAVMFFGSSPRAEPWEKYASLVSLVFLSGLLFSIGRWKRGGWGRSPWMWPALFCLWANMHRGVMIGLLVAACYAVGGAGLDLRERGRRAGWVALCAAATLLNPFGWKIYAMMSDDVSLSSQYIIGWNRPAWPGLEIFWICVALFWLIQTVDAWKTRVARWDDWSAAALLTWLAVRHNFAVPMFMIFAVPFIARAVHAQWKAARLFAGVSLRARRALLAAGLAAMLVAIRRLPVSGGVDHTQLPGGAFEMIADLGLPGPFYNDYFFGGYFMWRFGGQPPVFIDGRYPAVEGYKALLDEIYAAKFGRAGAWKAFLERHNIQGALMKYLPGSPFPSLYEVYFPAAEWALVYWDDAGLLYLRRDNPLNAAAIASREFREMLPDATPAYFMERYRAAPADRRKRLRQELWRNSSVHPESRRAQAFLSLLGTEK